MSVVFYELSIKLGELTHMKLTGNGQTINNEICANKTVPKGIQGRGPYLLDDIDLDMIQHLPYKYMINIDGKS